MPIPSSFDRYDHWLIRDESLGFSLDVSRMTFDDRLFDSLKAKISRAWSDLRDLEAGREVNAEENRKVGHYWLRNPALAPTREIRESIENTVREIHAFAEEVRSGETFRHVLLIGIGGSALGPQLLADALPPSDNRITLHFLDNTDPEGFDRVFKRLENRLPETLVIVASKSGKTQETRNGMLETAAVFKAANLDFTKHAVAVTVTDGDSLLNQQAADEGWLRIFHMADWVGGRTSVTSAVGLLPAALLGANIDDFLGGASEMDALTRVEDDRRNPAMLLALMWHHAGGGRGEKDMVILPYCDRLALFGKYLQQLVMESLGKELDRQQKSAHQGIVVYGNKGSTDQHAYVQQLRDGLNNFFATFVEIRENRDRGLPWMVVDPRREATAGDYLQGYLRGTRHALGANDRESITVSFDRLDARSLGALIALFERAVSFYASLIDVNAYHQPGVEGGKTAAGEFLDVVLAVRNALCQQPGESLDAAAIHARIVGVLPAADIESVYHAAHHLAASRSTVTVTRGTSPAEDRFRSA